MRIIKCGNCKWLEQINDKEFVCRNRESDEYNMIMFDEDDCEKWEKEDE